MIKFGTVMSMAALAGLFALAMPTMASADELEAQCKVGNPIDGADKICKCVSDKITATGDRAAAIKVMKATNDAMTKGASPDPSTWSDDMVKAMTNVATVEAGCMQ